MNIIIFASLLIAFAIFSAILYYIINKQKTFFNSVKSGDIVIYKGKKVKVIEKKENSVLVNVEISWNEIEKNTF